MESSKASTSVCGELEEEVVAHLFFISIFFCFSYLSYRTLRLKGCKAWIFKGWKLSHSLVPLHFLVEEGKFLRWCAGWEKMKVIFVFFFVFIVSYIWIIYDSSESFDSYIDRLKKGKHWKGVEALAHYRHNVWMACACPYVVLL